MRVTTSQSYEECSLIRITRLYKLWLQR